MQINNRRIGTLLAIFWMAWNVAAQNDIDSILNVATQQVYENPDKAIEIATSVYSNSETSTKYKISALLTISNAYTSKRDHEKSLETILQITSLFPELTDPKQKIGILNRIGAQYQDLKIYDKAIDYLDDAMVEIAAYPHQDSIQAYLGYNHIVRGFIYREQMSCDMALKYFDKAIEAFTNKVGTTIMSANASIGYYNKGNCLLAIDHVAEAELSFLQSIDYAKQKDAPSLIAFAQKGLAEVKAREGNYSEAIAILKSALQNAENVGDLVLNRGLYDGLSNNYLAINDWENYMLYRNKFLKLQKETKISERKSINQSMLNMTQTRAGEIEKFHAFYRPIQIGLIGFIIASLILLILSVISSEKKLKKLKSTLKM